jgi:hypothetical protein
MILSWFILGAATLYFYQERNHYRDTAAKLAVITTEQIVNDKKITYSADDLINARMQGKHDGKIEAILMVENLPVSFTTEQIEKIISIAEKQPYNQQEENSNFLGLLCRAAYHKGVTVGNENAKQERDDEYANGYHAALEQYACPETGKIQIPQSVLEQSKKK